MSTTQSFKQGLIAAFLALLLAGVSGCATNNPRDPLEPLNRGIYAFNDGLDTVILKPVAQGYRAVLPQFVRTSIGNFFSNLDDITVIANGILQFKIPQAVSDLGRFLINSTIGLLGFLDVATELGLEKHNEDFGQTLGYWGIGSGPYLVLPFLGPSTFRDALGRWVDSFTDLVWQEDHIRTRNQVYGTRAIDNRARLLDTEKVLQTAAIDEYAFIRDAYLQRRRNLIYDGNPPPEPEDDEPAAKPRGRVDPELKTVLVDQFGQVVAGGEAATGGIVPLLTEETSKPLPKAATPARTSEGATPASQAPAASTGEQIPHASERADATVPVTAPAPIVRVWLFDTGR
jgi:phospholipid-binding lipoprotein MlaA